MKVLVTGGAGFIGSHVVDMLFNAGHQVVVLDNLSTGRLENVNPQAKFYQVDIRSHEVEQIIRMERPEVIDHHAAQMDVRKSVEDPLFDAEVNVLAAVKLAKLAVKYSVRKFIHISSGGGCGSRLWPLGSPLACLAILAVATSECSQSGLANPLSSARSP